MQGYCKTFIFICFLISFANLSHVISIFSVSLDTENAFKFWWNWLKIDFFFHFINMSQNIITGEFLPLYWLIVRVRFLKIWGYNENLKTYLTFRLPGSFHSILSGWSIRKMMSDDVWVTFENEWKLSKENVFSFFHHENWMWII